MSEKWFRLHDGTRYADGSFSVLVAEYPVLHHTPKGVWLDDGTSKRCVMQPNFEAFAKGYDPGRRFAYPTEEMALWSYRRRKQRQVELLTAQLRHAERVHAAIKEGLFVRHRGLIGGAYLRLTDGKEDDFSFEEY